MANKGGRKAGANFARYSLEEMVSYAEALCATRKAGKLDATKVCTAVLNSTAKSTKGIGMLAALRAYGLVTGTDDELGLTKICQELPLAEDEELVRLLQEAFLSCPAFKRVYDNFTPISQDLFKIGTFTTTEVGVNVDNKEEFVDVFLKSLEYAKLGQVKDNKVNFVPRIAEEEQAPEGEEEPEDNQQAGQEQVPAGGDTSTADEVGRCEVRASVDIKIELTPDPDELKKQLAVLREYNIV